MKLSSYLALGFFVFNAVDIILTLMIRHTVGSGYGELNPIMAYVLSYSPYAFITVKLGIAALILRLWRFIPLAVQYGAVFLYSVIAGNNTVILFLTLK